ncbi:MAG: hypothetical protein MR715_01080, partial [Subdoligranulum sp.]|nr:hypothetical protein [Subdoligranulum sp.]
LPLLRFAVSATGGAHLCSIQYYLRFWLGICRTSLAVSALRIMRYCLNFLPVEQHTCRCAAHGFAKHQVDGTILFFFNILFQLFGHCFRRGKGSFAGIHHSRPC